MFLTFTSFILRAHERCATSGFLLRPVTKLFIYVNLPISHYALRLRPNQPAEKQLLLRLNWSSIPALPPPRPMCLGLPRPQEESPCNSGGYCVSLPLSTPAGRPSQVKHQSIKDSPTRSTAPYCTEEQPCEMNPLTYFQTSLVSRLETGTGLYYEKQEEGRCEAVHKRLVLVELAHFHTQYCELSLSGNIC